MAEKEGHTFEIGQDKTCAAEVKIKYNSTPKAYNDKAYGTDIAIEKEGLLEKSLCFLPSPSTTR